MSYFYIILMYPFLQALDHAGMDIIERMDPAGFTTYLKQYGNTICGRHPIGVFLNMIAEIKAGMSNGYRMDLKFLKYAQSSQVRLITLIQWVFWSHTYHFVNIDVVFSYQCNDISKSVTC